MWWHQGTGLCGWGLVCAGHSAQPTAPPQGEELGLPNFASWKSLASPKLLVLPQGPTLTLGIKETRVGEGSQCMKRDFFAQFLVFLPLWGRTRPGPVCAVSCVLSKTRV